MIVDDDPMARAAVKTLCKKTPLVNVVSICEDAKTAINTVNDDAIDLILLDIEMPGMNGIEFLNQVSYLPQVIFITSQRKYAYEAFEYQVTDFLEKPITLLRFNRAIEKATDIQKQINDYKNRSNDLYIRNDGRFIRLNYNDILFFENVGDYVRIKTEGQQFIIHSTLKNVDRKLRDPRFLKVHRSFVINLDKIKDIEENTLVIDKTVIPISRANKPILMSRLNFL
ncbi:MAG: LytTR family DNA-binding domain-containing protein [Bacteroidota bacterium]